MFTRQLTNFKLSIYGNKNLQNAVITCSNENATGGHELLLEILIKKRRVEGL
jgi:hypothetical protein